MRFAFLVLTLSVAAFMIAFQTQVVQEDGYYYFQIAQHLAQGSGSTFDGVNLTNGYQPLWLLMLVPIYWVTASAQVGVALGLVLQALFLAATMVLIYSTLRLTTGHLAATFAALLWFALVYQEYFKALEFGLHALGISLIAYLYLKYFQPALPAAGRMYLALGIICGLTFLARLDTLLLSAILAAFLLARGGRNHFAHVLEFAMPIVLTAFLYFGVNLYFFGYPLPVSGLVKALWSQQLLAQDPLYSSAGWLASKLAQSVWTFDGLQRPYSAYMTLGTFGMVLLAVIQIPLPAGHWLKQSVRRLAPFMLYSVLGFMLITAIFHDALLWSPWYYVMPPWLVVVFAGLGADRLLLALAPASPRLAQAVGTALCLVVLGTSLLYLISLLKLYQSGSAANPLYDTALWVRDHLPTGAIVGSWNAGTIGYYSNHRVVNLDGVVNSFDFVAHTRLDLCSYWDANHISYLADAFQGNRALSLLPTFPSYARCAARLELVWSKHYSGAPWMAAVYHFRAANALH